MVGIAIGAGILGLIIAVMEQDEFPGWFPMIVCVLAAIVPAAIINTFLPPDLSVIGLTVGSVFAGCAISAFCGMSVKRATIAATIWFAIQFAMSLGIHLMFSAR
ncbi:MAG: hypothetical protein JWM11_6807 [Planctomycetaceae bacterium]|nr:hypothetical protein [Planctomycetaceae bacterium]